MTLQERLRDIAKFKPGQQWRGRNAEMIKRIQHIEDEAADALDAKDERIRELEGALRAACILVNEQANDEGLWFRPDSVIEAYFQQELSRLHAHINRAREALK